jgi:hypothetical protein
MHAAPPPAPTRGRDLSSYLPKPILDRTTYPLDESDLIYFYGVGQIPLDEKPAPEPFILEERGIEKRESIFALDRGGLRFYLSRISGPSMNVSKTGMLLLNKQESLHLRGTHCSILNELRKYGLLLPFEFGTVTMGVDDLYQKIDEHLYELRDALEETVATKWWTVEVSALDAKVALLVASDLGTPGGREQGRRGAGRSAVQGTRLDIKTLERVLGREKSVAEEVHRQLSEIAGRADVDLIIGLNSGSSEDWKPILRASYEVSVPEVYRFNAAVADLQVVHLKYQLMFSITGEREDYALLRS